MLHLKRTNSFRCKVCKEEFGSRKLFRSHWDDSHVSYDAELKWLSGSGKKHDGYVMRPLESELIKHNLRSDSAYSALKSDFTVNELVIAEIDHGIENEAMTVAEIVGIPGSIVPETLILHSIKSKMYKWATIKELYNNRDKLFKIPALNKQTMKVTFQDAYVSKKKITEPILDIKSVDGRTIKATANHKFLIESKDGFEFIYGRDLENGDFIPFCKHILTNILCDDIEILGIKHKLDFDLGCLFGLFISDGSTSIHKDNSKTSYRVRFSNGNKNILSFYTKQINKFDLPVGEYLDKRDGKNVELMINGKSITYWFRNTFGAGAYNKCLPDWCYNTPEEFRRGLLIGLFLGDGSLYKQDTSVKGEFSTVSKNLWLGIQALMRSLGLLHSIGIKQRKTTPVYRIHPDGFAIEQIIGHTPEELRKSVAWDENYKSKFSRLDMLPLINENLDIPTGEKVGKAMAILRSESKRSNGENRQHIEKALKEIPYRTSYLNRLQTMINGDISWARIKSIEIAEEQPEWVYDIHVENNDNFMLANGMIIGNSGKSVFALSLARIIQMKWLERIIDMFRHQQIKEAYTPKIFLGFDLDTTLRHLREAKMGDTIIQDEDPEMMGAHSGSTKSQIENLMKVMRKACINFIFVSPVSTPYINMPNMVFEVIAKNKKLRRTKAALYDRKYHAVGWIIMDVLEVDDPLLIDYEKMKDINLEDIKQSGGRRSVGITEEQLFEDVKKLMDYLKKIQYNFTKRHTIADLAEHAGMAKVEGDTAYQRFVARTTLDFINQQMAELMGYGDEEGEIDASVKYLFIAEERYEDPLFLYEIYKSLPEAKISIVARSAKKPGENTLKKFKDKHAKAWMLYYAKGTPYDNVGDIMKVSGQSIANSYKQHGWNAIFQEEISGDCAEHALTRKYFKDYEVIGGFGKPDLINKLDKKNDWIEVKIRRRLSVRKEDLIRSFEYEFVDRGGKLRLALITYKQQECIIQMYRIVPNPSYKTTEEILDDIVEPDEDMLEDDGVPEFDIDDYK